MNQGGQGDPQACRAQRIPRDLKTRVGEDPADASSPRRYSPPKGSVARAAQQDRQFHEVSEMRASPQRSGSRVS